MKYPQNNISCMWCVLKKKGKGIIGDCAVSTLHLGLADKSINLSYLL